MTGTVKRVVVEKGFGFIKGEDEKEYFFHKTALVDISFESMTQGMKVEFTPEDSKKGLRAEDVCLG
jgi:CspA family cold shock protein